MLAIIALASSYAAASQFALPNPDSISGFVVDQNNSPVAGARVTLRTSAATIVKYTGQAGDFSFEEIQGASDTLEVEARGFAVRKLELASFSSREPLTIVLTPAELRESVTVTANRIETLLSETAASVTVIPIETIQSTSSLTIDDTLRQVPGFTLFRRSGSRYANPTSQGVSLRGVGASGASRSVVLYDGVPLNDAFGGWIYWGRLPREAISAMEVLEGGSSLYGSSALGGVINIFRKPAVGEQVSLQLSYGNQKTPSVSLFAAGRARAWSASIATDLFRTDGYVNVDRAERGIVDTPVSSRRATVEATVERSFEDDARVFARGSYYAESRGNGTPLQTNRTRIRSLVAGSDVQNLRMGNFNARAWIDVQTFEQSFSAVAANRNTETLTRLQRVPSQGSGATLQWSRELQGRNQIAAGAEWSDVRGSSDEIAFAAGTATALVDAGGRTSAFGFYIQDRLEISRRLITTFGVRFDRWKNRNGVSLTRPIFSLVNQETTFPDRTEAAWSPHASLLYKVNDSLSVYGSVNRAFRAPTLNELYRSFRVGDVVTQSNAFLRAEGLTGGEVGAGYHGRGEKFQVRGALFWARTDDTISNVTLFSTPSLITRQRQNLGRARSRGVDLYLEMRPYSSIWLSAGYLFVDSTVVEFPANVSLVGNNLPQVPRHSFAFQARYSSSRIATIALQARGSGRQFDDDQNRFVLERYFVFDAFVSRPLHKGLDVFVAVENLFNDEYSIGRTPVRTIGAPRLIRAGIRLQAPSR